jgi:two-component system cell cycle response regulator
MQPERTVHVLEDASVDLHDTILTHKLETRRSCRVLVVDDDELVCARLTALLRTADFEVESAGCGEEALRIMTQRPCQVLLTDWQMPDMDGLTLCRIVRSKHSDSYVYVLMLTVRESKEDILTGLAAGADEYVSKTSPVEEILARLEVARRITHVESSLRSSNRENRRLSVTDPLTGAPNLRYLMKQLPRELARAQRYGHSLAVLSCDIDRFKQINDSFGHDVGNDVLRAFVARTEDVIRKDSDWLARIGGDEFLIVLPETNSIGANRVAQKLNETFARFPVSTQAGPVAFTASIGVTAVDASHEIRDASKIEDLLRAADTGLYASKKLGGNQAKLNSLSIKTTKVAGRNSGGGRNGIN